MNRHNRLAAEHPGKSELSLKVRRRAGNPAAIALLVGCTTFVVGAAVAMVTTHYFPGTLPSFFADDFIIGASTGIVVFFYEQRRNRFLMDRLRVIQEVNHHIRNALQVISYASAQHENERLRTMVCESSERIQWTLREILQGGPTLASGSGTIKNEAPRSFPPADNPAV